jgi:hypothetical protein
LKRRRSFLQDERAGRVRQKLSQIEDAVDAVADSKHLKLFFATVVETLSFLRSGTKNGKQLHNPYPAVKFDFIVDPGVKGERKRVFLSHLCIKKIIFYQDRLGTNIGKLKKDYCFRPGCERSVEFWHGEPAD